jgi:hypothetical protein
VEVIAAVVRRVDGLRMVPWILLVLYVAYTGQAAGYALFSGHISGSLGAAAMTPVVV